MMVIMKQPCKEVYTTLLKHFPQNFSNDLFSNPHLTGKHRRYKIELLISLSTQALLFGIIYLNELHYCLFSFKVPTHQFL